MIITIIMMILILIPVLQMIIVILMIKKMANIEIMIGMIIITIQMMTNYFFPFHCYS